MRALDSGLAARLAAGVTTLCRCWRIGRADGTVLGFTDHDRVVSFDGVDHLPADGFDASEDVSATGFAPGGLDVSGALSADRLTEADLASGLYDGAEVTLHLVNWRAPAERHLLRTGFLGEVTRAGSGFTAEIRGLASLLDQKRGRLFQPGCDADLGDRRCGIDATSGTWRGEGTVIAAASRRRFTASGLDGFAAAFFERGRLAWTSGANAGRVAEIRLHRLSAAIASLDLWQPASAEIAEGDAFTVTAGCDKRFQTCREKFSNAINFRGFPHMPGNDFVLAYARRGNDNSGAALAE